MLPHGDPIHRLSAPLFAPRADVQVAWLRIEFASGRRFEIAPVEDSIEGERYPCLSIDVSEVQLFASAHAWPGGPEAAWFTPAQLGAVASLTINQDRFISSDNWTAQAIYEAELSSGQRLSIWHSKASPMTLELNLEPIWPNQSLEPTRVGVPPSFAAQL